MQPVAGQPDKHREIDDRSGQMYYFHNLLQFHTEINPPQAGKNAALALTASGRPLDKNSLDPTYCVSHPRARVSSQSTRRNQDKNQMPNPHPTKLLTLRQAARWTTTARQRGRRIVATNGCFDLLHFGHVSYLQRARKLGDLLVVGLNSDRSARLLKGPNRPLVPQRQRAAVLAALACVDAVVIFPDTRATRFLRAVRPDIYVKGGDYRPDTLDTGERATLKAVGAKVKILPFVRGFSTTRLIAKIRKTCATSGCSSL